MNSITSVLLCVPLVFSFNGTNSIHDVGARLQSDTTQGYLINRTNEKLNNCKNEYDTKMLNELSVELHKQQEQKRIEEENQKRIAEEESKYITKTFVITFYTDLNCENGCGSVNCRGEQLEEGMVANNVLPLGTEIDLGSMGVVRVADRGGSSFNTSNRLDMLIPREYGESDYHYYKRVNKMGKRTVTGKILKSSMR